MRPKTSESGIFSTNRSRPVSTSMLTRMLVPKPKNAFQSPGVHSTGRFISEAITVMTSSLRCRQRGDHRPRCRHGAEDAALGLDHLETHVVEFREIGRATVGEHDATKAAVVGFVYRGVD